MKTFRNLAWRGIRLRDSDETVEIGPHWGRGGFCVEWFNERLSSPDNFITYDWEGIKELFPDSNLDEFKDEALRIICELVAGRV